MGRDEKHRLPTWAPRVSRSMVRRFYESSGSGILDEELIDDLGIALLTRCESMIEVKDAKRGTVTCPNCQTRFYRKRPLRNDDSFACTACSWECDWPTYRKTFKGTLINPGSIESDCREYIRVFPTTKDYGRKIVLIDTLIHLIHGGIGNGNIVGALALIDGKITDVAEFLDQLTYGAEIPAEVRALRDAWRETVRSAPRFWSEQIRAEDDDPVK